MTTSWKIKLKEGFFRTVDCEMTLGDELLIVAPLEKYHHTPVELALNEIEEITMNRKYQPYTEVEIRTNRSIFVAQIMDPASEEALILELNVVFRSRFQVI